MGQKSLSNKNQRIIKQQRQPAKPMSLSELQSARTVSFQSTKGDIKTYITIQVKNDKEKGLIYLRSTIPYMKVANDHPRARKDEVFKYMNAKMQKKYHQNETCREITPKEALSEINQKTKHLSKNLRNGIRRY